MPQTERSRCARRCRERPQPLQLMGGREFAAARCASSSTSRWATASGVPSGTVSVNVVRNSAVPAPVSARSGSFGCVDSGVTSSLRHTRNGIDASTASSAAASRATKRPSVRHSPGASGGRHSRNSAPSAASWRERTASRADRVDRFARRAVGHDGRHGHEKFHAGSSFAEADQQRRTRDRPPRCPHDDASVRSVAPVPVPGHHRRPATRGSPWRDQALRVRASRAASLGGVVDASPDITT